MKIVLKGMGKWSLILFVTCVIVASCLAFFSISGHATPNAQYFIDFILYRLAFIIVVLPALLIREIVIDENMVSCKLFRITIWRIQCKDIISVDQDSPEPHAKGRYLSISTRSTTRHIYIPGFKLCKARLSINDPTLSNDGVDLFKKMLSAFSKQWAASLSRRGSRGGFSMWLDSACVVEKSKGKFRLFRKD